MSGTLSSATDDLTGAAEQLSLHVREAAMMRLPGADPSMVDVEFRYSVGEFLSRTLVWRRRIDQPITLNQGVYRLGLQAYEGVAALFYAEISNDQAGQEGNRRLQVGQSPLVQRPGALYGSMMVGMLDHQRVSFVPVPTENAYARFDVAVTLLPNVTAPYPDVLLPYQDILLSGVLARMMAMQDKPFTNLNLANYNQREFGARCQQTRREQDGGRAYGSIRPRIPKFGR